jgi:uncharacterized LabA/DUF88 family protein
MSKRACVFVDGENFRHAICDLFTGFDRKDYLPKKADWTGLFDWLVQEACPGSERIRSYWYAIQWMDFSPYSLNKLGHNPAALKTVLCQHGPFADQLTKLTEPSLSEKMQEMLSELREKQHHMQDRFNGWTAIQNNIAQSHRAIEFRTAGAIRYNLFDGSFGPEKAVDVKLATDLIVLKDIYDVAVIVSGDQDYVPAVQVIKNEGKTVVNVAFKTRGGRLLPGGARRLNQQTDESLEIEHSDLARYLSI